MQCPSTDGLCSGSYPEHSIPTCAYLLLYYFKFAVTVENGNPAQALDKLLYCYTGHGILFWKFANTHMKSILVHIFHWSTLLVPSVVPGVSSLMGIFFVHRFIGFFSIYPCRVIELFLVCMLQISPWGKDRGNRNHSVKETIMLIFLISIFT